MAEQDSKNVVIQLPWAVPQQPNIQTIVLQQPKDQQLVVKSEQDTDWISVGTIVLSLLAFIATIVIVRYSTKAQIESNKILVESQEKIKQMELSNEKNNAILLVGAEFIFLCEYLMYEAKNLQNNLNIVLDLDYVSDLTHKRDLMETLGTRLELSLNDLDLIGTVLCFKKEIIRLVTPGLNMKMVEVDLDYWNGEIRVFKIALREYLKNKIKGE